MRKKSSSLLLITIMGLLIISCERDFENSSPQPNPNSGLKTSTKGFSVKNGRLLDASGNDFILRGINYPYEWFSGKTPTALPAIGIIGANSIRVILESSTVKGLTDYPIIASCEAQKLVIVLENHLATGKNDTASLMNAARYFVKIKSLLIGKEDRIIINIANEWTNIAGQKDTKTGQDLWSQTYKLAVALLRNAGLNHTIMIDAAHWGQDYQTIVNFGWDVFNSDPNKNIIFSVHIYENSGINAATIKSGIDGILSTGLPFCIGEFGPVNNGKQVDYQTVMSYCQEKRIGWMAWSWAGNDATTAALDMDKSPNFDGTALTPWGDSVIYGKYGLWATSKPSAIYIKPIAKPLATKLFGPFEIDLNTASDFAFYGINTCIVGDGVKIFNLDGTAFSPVGAGTYYKDTINPGKMSFGVWTHSSKIVSGLKSGVELREPGSQVIGDIISRGPIIGSPIERADIGTYKGTMFANLGNNFTGTMFFRDDDDINIAPGTISATINAANSETTYPLAPGTYSEFNIGSRNNIVFEAGTYYFTKFTTQPDVKLVFPTTGKVIIFVQGDISIASRTQMLSLYSGVPQGANPKNILFVAQGKYVFIQPQVNWRGTLVATNGFIDIGSNTEGMVQDDDPVLQTSRNLTRYKTCHPEGELYGAILGKHVQIHQRSALYFIPFDWANAIVN